MKKITFILLALISGTAFGQNSESATTTVNAEIVDPIGIESSGDNLDFGKIAVGPSAGAVRVLTDNTATYSDPGMKIPSNVVNAATFTITGAPGGNFGINIPSISLTGPGADMPLSFDHNLKPTGNIAGTDTELKVGGLLTVNAEQVAGNYGGTVTVTVSYE